MTIPINIIFFLPILSAYGANSNAPRDIPSKPELKTIPKVSSETDQEDAIRGAVYEITKTSIPSTKFKKKHIKITTNG